MLARYQELVMAESNQVDVSDAFITEGEETSSIKEKVAVQSLRGDVTQEDASRSNLHYGNNDSPEANGTEHSAVHKSDGTEPAPLAGSERTPVAEASDVEVDDAAHDGQTFANPITANTGQVEDVQPEAPQPETSTFRTPQDSAASGTLTSGPGNESTATNATATPPVSQPATAAYDADGPTPDDDAPTPNAAPTQISLSMAELVENDEGAVVGQLSVVDPNASDQHTFLISDDRFEIVEGQIRLKPGVSLDHEQQASLQFDITATDADGASFTETFEIFVADVNEAPTSVSIDQSLIATNQPGAGVGLISVIDPDEEGTYEFTLSDNRFEVAQGQLKLRDDVSLDTGSLGNLAIDVTVTDQGGETITQTFEVGVVEPASITMTSGFQASYYDVDHRLSELDQIDWSGDATHEEVVGEINYTNSRNSFWDGGSKDTFGAKITGNIEVQEGGSFDFFLGGDDGVILLINGEEVIDNDGLHGYRTRSGEIELEPGTHSIEVRYFENYGHAGLKLEWEGPGTDGRELVTAPGFDDLQTVNGMPIALEIDVATPETAAADQVSHHVEGLPPGTILEAGNASIETDADGTADISGLDLSLLTVTTPIDFTGQVSAQIVTTTQIGNEGEVSVASDLSFTVNQADITPPSAQLETGFRASYFDVDHRLSKLDQIDWSSEATHEEVVGDINYTNSSESFWQGGSKDTFGVQITGSIEVEEGGSFDFFLGGDDGAILLINGEEVIDNDGLHGYRTRTGEVELEPGTHEIEVRYFENYGHAGLKLEWEGPGTEGRELVTANDELAVPQNGMLDLGIDDASLSDAATVTISGLPADTILISDNNVAVADGGEIDLSGWDLSLLEMAPPPDFQGVISGEITTTDTAFNGQKMTGNDTFSIEVGDVENQQDQNANAGASDEWASYENDGSSPSWTDAANDDDSAEEQGDDPMSEEVIDNQGAEQGPEMNETYERQDW
ncbi:PA14 domain-containing protein [uncultured Roseobacter sp.]|uniref:PA14 domain-containing protein n=1 Tax=uncultured Roseobacter sp. TaxID=114847 RepID=UPI002611EB42|nr:PA14 domain-containing protein [uncultured Roseobacter sp.]